MRVPLLFRLLMLGFCLGVNVIFTTSQVSQCRGQSTTEEHPTTVEQPASNNNLTPPQISENVQSIFQQHCWKCHSEKSSAAGLNLQSWEHLMAGGDSGSTIQPGAANQSRLVTQLAADAEPHMPPMGQLSDEEIQTIRQWVDQLAPQPASIAKTPPASSPSALAQGIPISLAIDLLIHQGYTPRAISSAPVCDDETFARRVYLDLTGRIPTIEELHSFLSQTDSRKRQILIDQLIDSDAYAQNMAAAFDTMLMGRNEKKRNQRNGWKHFLETSFRSNKPWNDFAEEVLLARPIQQQRDHLWYLFERDNNHQEIAESIAKGFFGIDIACAQCHDHPLASEIKQAHYWGLVAFYKRTKNENQNGQIALTESAVGGFDDYANALKGTTDSAVLTFLGAEQVDEVRPEDPSKQEDKEEYYINTDGQKLPKFSRREKFVREIVSDHPLLARAMVNRVWGLMMGRGLVHPIEKMDSTYPASHPELLDWLSQDFENHNYDVKRLVRGIVSSQTYQLCSKSFVDSPADDARFAYGLVRPLSAERLLNSLEIALGLPIDDDSDAAKQWRELFPDVVPENQQTNLKQALLLTNYPALNQLIQQAASQQITDSSPIDTAKIEQTFLQVFGRKPESDELQAMIEFASDRQDRPIDAMSQILWAMVTSAEFRFNH